MSPPRFAHGHRLEPLPVGVRELVPVQDLSLHWFWERLTFRFEAPGLNPASQSGSLAQIHSGVWVAFLFVLSYSGRETG